MKLSEGSRYNFKVEKKIDFDNSKFWVLLGPDKRKYLLSFSDYSSYDISEGKTLDCRVDKINCKGEVFLEPLHPYYKEGSVYNFRVLGFDYRIDKSGRRLKVVIFTDDYDSKVLVPLEYFGENAPGLDSSVSLKIEQIVKGSILIYGSTQQFSAEKKEDLKLYDFRIINESKGLDNRNYLIVEDKDKAQYTIPAEYYSHYKLAIGDSFKGRFIRYKEGHGVSVEPDSPFFAPGKSYDFTVSGFVKVSDGIDDLMIIKDSYGYEHQVKPRDKAVVGDKITYSVVKMRKGWPLLKEV